MKSLKISSVMFMLTVLMFTVSCQKDKNEQAINTSSYEAYFDDPQFMMNDLNVLEEPEITDPSEDVEFRFRDSSDHDRLPPCLRPLRKFDQNDRNRAADPKALPFVLKALKLDSSQRIAVKGYMKDQCDCIADHIKKVQEMNHHILKEGNQKRMELIKSYKANVIDRNQLREALIKLRLHIIQDLRENNPKHLEMQIAKKCRDNFFKNVSSILTHEQNQKWIQWIKSH